MRCSRRSASVVCALLGLALLTGCNQLSFMPQPKKKVVTGFDAVRTGMSERQVVQLLGEPSRRNGINMEGTTARGKTLTFVKGGRLMTITLAGDTVIAKEKY